MTERQIDIRWEQRFSNYGKALQKLSDAVRIINQQIDETKSVEINELQCEGLIQRFEYTHELAWNVMADYAKYQGYLDIKGSRDAIRFGLKMGLIDDEVWMKSIVSRNRTTHTYNEQTAKEILDEILIIYHPLFLKFEQRMSELIEDYHQ